MILLFLSILYPTVISRKLQEKYVFPVLLRRSAVCLPDFSPLPTVFLLYFRKEPQNILAKNFLCVILTKAK